MSAEFKNVPKAQVALSGGPPKPPKRTSRGLEDGGPDPDSAFLEITKDFLETVESGIEEQSKQLLHPRLSCAERAQHEDFLKHLQKTRRWCQNKIAQLERKETGDAA